MQFDVVIIGSGMGGSAVAYALRHSGASVLVLERGDYLPAEADNWDVSGVQRYRAAEQWRDCEGRPIEPRIYYNVGGNSKVYGAAMLRYREEDFSGVEHEAGRTVPWPISYADLRPHYAKAEALLGVRGQAGEDPTEPPRAPFPHPVMPHEPVIEELAAGLRAQGLHPFHLPVAVDFGVDGDCIRCATCDGFPCQVGAKNDAETRLLRPALAAGSVQLWTGARVERLTATPNGRRVAAAEVNHRGERKIVTGGTFVLSAGAINSAALLLKSKSDRFPNGLANSSGQVGRNYMAHNNSVIMAVDPRRKNPTRFQKTLALNDFYRGGSASGKPLGHIQMRGKILPEMLARKTDPELRRNSHLAEHSVDLWLMSEDLPDPENRVRVDGQGRVHLIWRPNNQAPHRELVERTTDIMRVAGYTKFFVERRGVETISHQCGTVRFGRDPATAVLDEYCRSFDLPNLFVVDTGFYPSSAAVNPALTLAAQALRAAGQIK